MKHTPAKFDGFADNYRDLHNRNIKITGEDSEFFAEYKVRDLKQITARKRSAIVRSIIDFGGGIGNSLPFIRQYFPDAQLAIMDVSSKSLTAAEATYGREACYIQFDGETIPQIEPVDLIFAACVFHHIDARFHISLLSQLRSKLGTTGMLAIYEHNPWNPVTRWAVNRCEFDDDAVLITGQEMRRRLRRAGFAEPKLEYRVFFPGQLGSFRFIEPHLWWAPIGAQYVTYGMR